MDHRVAVPKVNQTQTENPARAQDQPELVFRDYVDYACDGKRLESPLLDEMPDKTQRSNAVDSIRL